MLALKNIYWNIIYGFVLGKSLTLSLSVTDYCLGDFSFCLMPCALMHEISPHSL